MWSRYSTTRPDYAFTRKWIFESEEFLQMVFIIGVANANKMLVEPYKSRWKTFLLYEMPEMFKEDCFTTYNYMLICDFIKEMQEFAANYAEAAPHHIQEAEEKAPKETWKSPISFKEWMERDYERRWGRQRGL